MKNLKKLVSVVFIIVFLVMLSSCGKSIEKHIIGKWFNSENRCLEIQKDGSYILEKQYGKGKWQILDDTTIEFVDFYGERDTAVFSKIDGEICIDFGYYGKFYQKEEEENNNHQISKNEYLFDNGSGFSNGVAWVEYKNASKENNIALIDTKGKVLYKTKVSDEYYVEEMCNRGINCYILKDRKTEKRTYYLFDSRGNLIANSDNGLFDSVLAIDNGQALVYKNTSNINEESYTIGVIGIDGKYEFPTRKYEGNGICFENTSVNYYIKHSFYSGSNVWSVKGSNDHLNINVSNGKYIWLDQQLKYYNGFAYYEPDNEYWSEKEIVRYDTDFKEKELSDMSGNCLKDCMLFKCEIENHIVEKLEATNLLNNKTFSIESYNSKASNLVLDYINNYIIESMFGKDNKKYFTIIDENGKKLFEPKVGSYESLSDDILVYKNENKTYSVLDLSDNTLTENLGLDYIGEFHDELACAREKDSETKFYINKKGEKVLYSISE